MKCRKNTGLRLLRPTLGSHPSRRLRERCNERLPLVLEAPCARLVVQHCTAGAITEQEKEVGQNV